MQDYKHLCDRDRRRAWISPSPQTLLSGAFALGACVGSFGGALVAILVLGVAA